MLGKFVIILLCCALIETKIHVRKNHHHEAKETNREEDTINVAKFLDSIVEKSQITQQDETGENSHILESPLKTFPSVKKNQKNDKDEIKNSPAEATILENPKITKPEETIINNVQSQKISANSEDQYVDNILSRILENYQNEFQGVEDLLRRDIDKDIKYLDEKNKETVVGFGGNPRGDPKRIMFGNMTTYVNKAINQIQHKLKQDGRRIYANIPPYVIYRIPHTPIIFKLKYIEGAPTLATQGTSMGLHYFDTLYCYTQFKFQEIRYYYEVQIKPMNLFTIRKSITVVLETSQAWNSRVWMPVAVENNKLTIQRFEFVLPDVTVECADHSFINYILNDIVIDEYYPDTKQKLAQIAARDTKLLLDAYVEDAQ